VLFEVTDRLYQTTTKIFRVVECRACHLVRLDPWPSPEELARYYPKSYWFDPGENASGKWIEAYRRFVLRDHVHFVWNSIRAAHETGLVLDVGCGGGLFLRMLRETGLPVLGLDALAPAASVAWKSNGVPAVCADLLKAPLRRESCSAITMFHVLEHLYEPEEYLDRARELLRPNGRLIVQVPNVACWQFVLLGERWNGIDVPRHLVDFRQKDVEHLLHLCGFEVLTRKHFSLRDNPAGFATSLAPGLDPMARRIRGVAESPAHRTGKDLLYFGLVCLRLPVAMLEAACGAGSTIMIEARKRA